MRVSVLALFGASVLTGAEAFSAFGPSVASRHGHVAVSKLPASSSLAAARKGPALGLSMVATGPNGTGEMVTQLVGAEKEIRKMLDKTNAQPIMIRLAWHDSGTHDCSIGTWPECGGAMGSIRFDPEINHGANAGLASAVQMLEPIKKKFPMVSYADLFQMASAVSVEMCGGPKIPMKYGRVDAAGPEECSPEGNLPDAEAADNGKYGGAGGTASTEDTTPYGHLRKVFYRMGMNDEEIVALSGAHTLGRAWKDRSGLGAEQTKFTSGDAVARADGKPGIGKKGGSSWTPEWLKFDNSYFQVVPDEGADKELLKLSTDKTLFADEGFKPYAEKFRDSEKSFFFSYSAAHSKLSELGSKFVPEEGIVIDSMVKAKMTPSSYSANRQPWEL